MESGFSFLRNSAPTARYTVVGETLRYVIPSHMQCSIGCGGRACKYEDPSRWSDDEQAIKGIYSSWVTENLLAMARPSTEIIEKYSIIEQFQRCGLKTVINLQRPGEHANCGNPLEPESGFTYCPEIFMNSGIYFYNFGWDDYGVASLPAVLDMVKVMSFAVQEGKLAVHCHAGLGRTGVLLACYLVFTTRMTADQAIIFVRSKRPNSIQTRGQLLCVREFVKFLVPLRNIFSCAEPRVPAVTLSQFLIRQKNVLHGYEARQMKYMPKIIQLICKILPDIVENRQVIEEDVLEVSDISSDSEVSVSYSRVQHFSRPFMVNGTSITYGVPPRLPGLPQLRKKDTEPPLFYARKSLSYSDSDLRRLAETLNLSENPMGVLAALHRQSMSQGIVNDASEDTHIVLPGSKKRRLYSSNSSIWELKTLMDKEEGPPLLQSRRQSVLQRSKSVGDNNGMADNPALVKAWRAERELGRPGEGDNGEEERSEVPFITIQSELTLEARRLLVAQALAVDLSQDGEENHKQRVSAWQAELNCGAGVWERLCLEKDPFVLTGLMWSWLEHLKEPVVSLRDVLCLEIGEHNPHTILNRLEKASKETITCILECFARLLTVPEEVENAFLQRLTKAFTKIDKDSTDGKRVYGTMKTVLRPILEEMRKAARVELEILEDL
ncbi:protein tyrosine phosphatase domain-containing protein 1 isoform X1 [Denticeps clupeoides]|uniref:Protein tyrosine phosphatase domain-containing protein 1 n=1 Tax=Denticeps clupeoides TaxID=299321 RepID=A0AAY4B7F1_9TELE|nr:protein tyrosine phosphatase domain-containing protein 1-like isoform X1 [Denticeps clupeoides]